MAELTSKAWELMILGMGTVFIFLALLVLAVSVMSRALARFADAPVTPKTASGPLGQPSGTNRQVPPKHRQAIELAIARHRTRK